LNAKYFFRSKLKYSLISTDAALAVNRISGTGNENINQFIPALLPGTGRGQLARARMLLQNAGTKSKTWALTFGK
jgi:hypothetical protein